MSLGPLIVRYDMPLLGSTFMVILHLVITYTAIANIHLLLGSNQVCINLCKPDYEGSGDVSFSKKLYYYLSGTKT